MTQLVCISCATWLRIKKTGAVIIEELDEQAVKLWSGDIFECPQCGFETAAQLGKSAFARSSEQGFTRLLEQVKEKNSLVYVRERR